MAMDAEEPKDRLRWAREEAKLSRGQLAEKTGISESTIRAHENGQNNIRPHTAIIYARALGVEAPWLLYGGESLIKAAPPDDYWKYNRAAAIVGKARDGFFPIKEEDSWMEARVEAYLANNREVADHILFVPVPDYANVSEFFAFEEIKQPSDDRYRHYVIIATNQEEIAMDGDEVVLSTFNGDLRETDVFKFTMEEDWLVFYKGATLKQSHKVTKVKRDAFADSNTVLNGIVVCRVSIRRRPILQGLWAKPPKEPAEP